MCAYVHLPGINSGNWVIRTTAYANLAAFDSICKSILIAQNLESRTTYLTKMMVV